jgi:hypothetical protein
VIFERDEFMEEERSNVKEIGGCIMEPAIQQGVAVLTT